MKSVLVIAGSDPTAGAGIEQDLRVLEHFGIHGTGVATALTEQDSARVHSVNPMEPQLFERRLRTLLHSFRPDAVKIGMLARGDLVRVVARAIEERLEGVPIVIDPVIRSTSGAALLDDEGFELMRSRLVAMAHLITPNRDEARALAGRDGDASPDDLAAACKRLGPRAVVVTGGDVGASFAEDVFVDDDRRVVLSSPRRSGRSPHGTGCAFATAATASLASGRDVLDAVVRAKEFVSKAIARAVPLENREPMTADRRSVLVFRKGTT